MRRWARLCRWAPLAVLAFGLSSALGEDTAGVTRATPGGWFEALMFYTFAGIAVVSAIGVCVSQRIVRMAVWLFFSLTAVSVMYFLLAANFLAALQLIVYVGGVLVLLLFGVMLTGSGPWARFTVSRGQLITAGVTCVVLLACFVVALLGADWGQLVSVHEGASVEALGRRLITTYVFPFEIAGVLLMIVMVGAAHLARSEKQ